LSFRTGLWAWPHFQTTAFETGSELGTVTGNAASWP
jgi:hypothetical protein